MGSYDVLSIICLQKIAVPYILSCRIVFSPNLPWLSASLINGNLRLEKNPRECNSISKVDQEHDNAVVRGSDCCECDIGFEEGKPIVVETRACRSCECRKPTRLAFLTISFTTTASTFVIPNLQS